MTTPIAGTWCIREVGTNQHTPAASLNSYNAGGTGGARPQILGAMNPGCFVGFGLRVGWDHIETGRLLTTSIAALNSTTIAVATNHPALANGATLSFATYGGTPVSVTLSAAAAANSASISVVGAHAVITSGSRAGVYDDQVLNACYGDIQPLGYMFAPRIMNGKYCPANLVTDGSPTHSDGNGTYPEPYDASGTPNPILLHGLDQLYRHIFAWADTKNAINPGSIPIINVGTIPGLDYAETYFSGSLAGGDYVAQLHGASLATNKTRMVTANNLLMDQLVAISSGRYPIAFGLSGVGALADVIAPGIAAHAATFGDYNNLVYVNANGWNVNATQEDGEWGAIPATEATFDANVWSVLVKRGVQDISPDGTAGGARTAADWIDMFTNHALGLPTRDASWAEIYAYQVRNGSGTGTGNTNMNANQAAWNQMVASAVAFNAAVLDAGTVTTLPAGTTTYTAHTTVEEGDVLQFPPNSSATLIMDNKNLVVYGTLRMRPANPSIVHLLQFTNVDEQIMTGSPAPSPTGMPPRPTPTTTDIGLWVLNNGVLDAIGSPKVGWNRTGDDPTWLVGDEMYRSPWGAVGSGGTAWYATYPVHTKGAAMETITDPWGGVHTNEAFNLTRNVRIEGTPGHNTHVIISTDVPQTIKYTQLRYVGPRHNASDPNTSVVLRGRWGMHLHHLMDAGYNTLIEGVVVRNNPSHAFVSHGTNGTTFRDCIAFNVNEDAYWWDAEVPSDDSHDVLFDHCMCAVLIPIPSHRGFQLAAFVLGAGVPDPAGIVNDCVSTGNRGNANAASYIWPENASRQQARAVWDFTNNVSHNNLRQGIYFWRNEGAPHVIDRYTGFNNGQAGVRHGAYTNTARYTETTEFDNGAGFSELAANAGAVTQLGHRVDNSHIEYLLFREKVLPTYDHPAVYRDCTIESVVVQETPTTPNLLANAPRAWYDFVNCDPLEPSDWNVLVIGPLTRYRIQRADNTAYQITDQGTVVIPPFYLYVSTLTLPQAAQNVAYNQPLSSALGTGTVTWGLKAGSAPLPAGMALSTTGVLSGTPTTAGVYPVTVEARDSAPDEGHIAHRTMSIIVASAVNLQLTTTTLPNGEVGVAYSQPLAATGGTAPYTFSLATGSLPPGLAVASSGVVSGTPTTAGTYLPTFRVADSTSATAIRQISMTVANLNPFLTTPDLPPGENGLAYVASVQAGGGTGPYTFVVELGPLPPGIAMATTGVFSGTPTTPGVYPVRIRVTDSSSHAGLRDYTIETFPALELPTPSLQGGFVGQPYTDLVTAIGGAPPLTFDVPDDDEPLGLEMQSNGVLSGIPTTVGTVSFIVSVFDGLGVAAQALASVTIEEPVIEPEIDRNPPKAFGLRLPQGGSRMRDRVR